MRLFLGAPLPVDIRKLLVSLYELFNSVPCKLKFVPFENLHITLRFLGEQSSAKEIINSLSGIDFNSFNASIENFSVFPGPKFIRIIHSPVTLGSGGFIELYKKITSSLNLKPERFTPHATIARVKGECSPINILSITHNITFKEEFTASSFNLYKSTLTPKGPVYEVLKEFRLKT